MSAKIKQNLKSVCRNLEKIDFAHTFKLESVMSLGNHGIVRLVKYCFIWRKMFSRQLVSIKTRSTRASPSFKGEATKHTTLDYCLTTFGAMKQIYVFRIILLSLLATAKRLFHKNSVIFGERSFNFPHMTKVKPKIILLIDIFSDVR